MVEQLETRFPRESQRLADAAEAILAFTGFPKSRRRHVWPNNPQARVNREVRRRTEAVGIFTNRAAIVRPWVRYWPSRTTNGRWPEDTYRPRHRNWPGLVMWLSRKLKAPSSDPLGSVLFLFFALSSVSLLQGLD